MVPGNVLVLVLSKYYLRRTTYSLMLLSKYYLLLDVGEDESVGPEGGLHHVQPHSPQLLPAKVRVLQS